MQPRAAHRTPQDAGWKAAFLLALCAATLSAVVLAVVLNRDPDPAESVAPVSTEAPAARATATISPADTPTAAPTKRPTPRRPTATVAPVQPFGRSVTLVEDKELREAIEDVLGDDRKDDFSVVVVRPSDGRAALVDGEREFYAASLFKLAILYEAGLRLSRGEITLDDYLEISEEDLEQDLGTLEYQERDEDGNLTLRNALEAMVTVSDNSTAVALLHLFGSHNVDQTLRDLGIEATSVNTKELPTTARDMARIMDAIVAGEGLDPASHELLLGMLSRQTVRSGIPRGLPGDVQSGNKTGTWEDITHDVAYVEAATGTYIIAVLSATDRDWDAIAEVSEAVYELMAAR
ncbi:MAG: serine hydrolase [Dehalococcoidia bacterium]